MPLNSVNYHNQDKLNKNKRKQTNFGLSYLILVTKWALTRPNIF
jgi:hypothetical protein